MHTERWIPSVSVNLFGVMVRYLDSTRRLLFALCRIDYVFSQAFYDITFQDSIQLFRTLWSISVINDAW